MSDLILNDPRAQEKRYLRAGESGRKAARELDESDDIVVGLVEWCRLLLRDTDVIIGWDGGDGFSQLLALPPNQSPLRAMEWIEDLDRRGALRDLFQGFLERSGRHDRDVMAWLLGEAIAKALVKCLELADEMRPGTVSGLQNMATSNSVAYYSFEKCLTSLLGNNPTAFAAMLSDIDRYIREIVENPGIGNYSRDTERVELEVEQWRSLPATEKLFHLREHEMSVRYRMLDLLPVIAPLDRARVLQLLDEFDFPTPVRQVLWRPSILHDCDKIAAMLKEAPNCIDDSDRRIPWNQKLTAVLLLEAAEAHCRILWREAGNALEEEDTDEDPIRQTGEALSSWLQEIGAIVMTRPDGKFLGSLWLLRKAADERKARLHEGLESSRRHKELREERMVEWIARGLFDAGLQGRDVERLVELADPIGEDKDISPVRDAQPKRGSEPPRLGTFAMSALLDHVFGSSASRGVEEHLQILDAMLRLRDPAFDTENIMNTHHIGLPANCCGHLYANVVEPAARWKRSWDLLVEQRRRAQHWRETNDGDALAPSLFLLASAAAALQWLISCEDRDRREEEELWRAAFDGARDCWLTVSVAPFSERVARHVEYLFALHPKVFDASIIGNDLDWQKARNTINQSYSERLSEDLFVLGGDDLMVAACLANAHRNDASLETIREMFELHDGHVQKMLTQFEKWQEVERSIRRRPDLNSEIDKLKRNLSQNIVQRNDTEGDFGNL